MVSPAPVSGKPAGVLGLAVGAAVRLGCTVGRAVALVVGRAVALVVGRAVALVVGRAVALALGRAVALGATVALALGAVDAAPNTANVTWSSLLVVSSSWLFSSVATNAAFAP